MHCLHKSMRPVRKHLVAAALRFYDHCSTQHGSTQQSCIACKSYKKVCLLHCTAEHFEVHLFTCPCLLYTDVFLNAVRLLWQVHPKRSLYLSGECLCIDYCFFLGSYYKSQPVSTHLLSTCMSHWRKSQASIALHSITACHAYVSCVCVRLCHCDEVYMFLD